MASYLLSYDVGAIAPMHAQLVAFVQENRHVKQWIHPYAGLFLLKSDAEVWTLGASFRSFFTDANNHIVVPISSDATQGIMPTYVWSWLNQSDQAPISGLLALLQEQAKK